MALSSTAAGASARPAPGAARAERALAAVGTATRLPATASVIGSVPAAQQVPLTVMLEPQDPSGLASFATAVSTPSSALFRQYLSVAEFAQRFGAPVAHIAAVTSALQAAGLSVGSVSANDLALPVSGTAAQVEQALSVKLSEVKLPTGRTAFANLDAPRLPASIASDVEGVIGLGNVGLSEPVGPQSVSQVAKQARLSGLPQSGLHSSAVRPHILTNGGPQPCSEATAAAQAAPEGTGYTYDLVATAYGFPTLYQAGDFGQGQTVALFEEQPYQTTDVAEFAACYGITPSVTNVNVDGGPGAYTPNSADDDGEAALDIETVMALAPKANILVYQGPNPGQKPTVEVDLINAIVSADQAKVISVSYGECETLAGGSTMTGENTLLQEAATQGQTFLAASGDDGSSMCYQQDQSNTSLSVLNPASQPFATGVGGTGLYAPASGGGVDPYAGGAKAEGVWNDGTGNISNGPSGTGGGISSQWPMPAYQSGAASFLSVINNDSSAKPCGSTTDCREVPDVSALADPFTGYVTYANGGSTPTGESPGGWGIVGGTSAATPLWAALIADSNDSSTCRGLSLGFLNSALYQIAGSSYLSDFNDITAATPWSGLADNDALGDNNGLYPVTADYDMTTGLGTPVGNVLGPSLCSVRAPVYTVAVTSPGTQASFVGAPVGLQVHGSDSGGQGLSYTATGLPAGLSMSPAGVISGTPATAQTTTVTVTATDPFTNAGATQFAWTVINRPQPPTAKSVSLSGLGKGKPKLSFTVDAGEFAPALKSVTISLPKGLSFARKTKTLDKGITLKSGSRKIKFTTKRNGGSLTISFRTAVTSASVKLVRPAITISSGEAKKIRKHKLKKLTVDLKTTDTSDKTANFAITLKKLS